MAMAAVAAKAVTAMAGPLRTLPDLIVFCLPPSAEDGVESAQKTFSLFKKKKLLHIWRVMAGMRSGIDQGDWAIFSCQHTGAG